MDVEIAALLSIPVLILSLILIIPLFCDNRSIDDYIAGAKELLGVAASTLVFAGIPLLAFGMFAWMLSVVF